MKKLPSYLFILFLSISLLIPNLFTPDCQEDPNNDTVPFCVGSVSLGTKK